MSIGAFLAKLSKLGSEQLKLAERMESVIADKLETFGSASKKKAFVKAFQLLGGKGSIKGRVVKSVLGAATRYEVSAMTQKTIGTRGSSRCWRRTIVFLRLAACLFFCAYCFCLLPSALNVACGAVERHS